MAAVYFSDTGTTEFLPLLCRCVFYFTLRQPVKKIIMTNFQPLAPVAAISKRTELYSSSSLGMQAHSGLLHHTLSQPQTPPPPLARFHQQGYFGNTVPLFFDYDDGSDFFWPGSFRQAVEEVEAPVVVAVTESGLDLNSAAANESVVDNNNNSLKPDLTLRL